ncbi:YdcF family protein [Xanthomarina gelatinilytica]|uniref:YdcF family protein n=1 Tax=Xanthomarina gelatinilytica TaxID=1137281 RepID=UPI003AA7C8A7
MDKQKVILKSKLFDKISTITNIKNRLSNDKFEEYDLELNYEVDKCNSLLKKYGYCVLEIDNNNILCEDEVIKIFSYFLKQLGSLIPVFQNENLLWRKIGVNLNKHPQSSEGIGNSPLHIDFVNSTNPPDLVGLLCVKPDINGGGISLVSNIKDASQKLNIKDRKNLMKNIFENGLFYNLSNIGKEYSPFPIIPNKENDFIRFTEKLTELKYSTDINIALKNLLQILNENLICIPLKKFQLLLLDQQQVVHGKTELKGRQENIPISQRRELLQIFIRKNMEKINKHAKILFEFLGKHYSPNKPDFILVLGSSDLRVAEFASQFCIENPTKSIIVSGGYGKVTKDLWNVSEAKKFSDIMIKNGVPNDKIYLDEEATNTGDNIQNAKSIIKRNNLSHTEGVLITKPYMTKRAFNTASKQWDEVKWSSISENISFEDYIEKVDDKDKFINVLVGDLQRIKVYGDKGFQIKEDVPKNVWSSFEYLSKSGFNKFVLKD